MRASAQGARDGTRTRGLFLTKEVLYRLSYASTNPPAPSNHSTPTGNRTPVFALRTRRPRPLDDGGGKLTRHCARTASRAGSDVVHVRRDSNPQPPVLETGALPLELRTSGTAHCQRAQQSGQGQNRTVDTTIFSRVLYQLSYLAPATGRSDNILPTKSPRGKLARGHGP